jgi:primosomal protein N' (replication factor Y) (superfamily II helicase)
MRLVRVAVPVPLLDALTYSLPAETPEPPPGARVLVPLGNRVLTGVVLPRSGIRDPESDADSRSSGVLDPAATVKDVLEILDVEPFLPEDVVKLCVWVADYYACGVGEAVATALPPRARIASERHAQITDLGHARMLTERGQRREILEMLAAGKPLRIDGLALRARAALAALERDGLIAVTQPLKGTASAYRTVRAAALTAQGHEVLATEDAAAVLRLGDRQREAIHLLGGSPEGIDTSELAARGIPSSTVARLARLGLVSIVRRRVERHPPSAADVVVERPALSLTDEQTAALHRLRSLSAKGTFSAALVHGVTGSGKTEIYLRLADDVRRQGKGVLLLVPEIALTPAAASTFRATFGERVAIQHSGLSDGERHDQWQRIRRGDVDVVVGTRSAVFAPVKALGLVVVDEEHDGSYKQEESPRYHGRDVAVMRGRMAGALVVLGSATPAMESYHNAQTGRYALIALQKRVMDRPLADVRIVNMRDEYAAAGPDVILSGALTDAMGARLEEGEQSIVLLNRRGYAASVFCRQCASTVECPNCSVSLTVHRAARRARCHYCNYSMAVPKTCAKCAGPYLEQIGFGTERVEADIVERFPRARVARVDRDTIRRRGAIGALLKRFAAGELDVLVGTQMIAKGHDFPRVTLVGVISADVGLGLADFRAAERTFQLLTQVAGRAGRGEIRGEAIVQTLYPEHYSIRHACRQDYKAFFEDEIHFRRAMRYPPAVALINAVVKARTHAAAMDDASEIVQALRGDAPAGFTPPYRVLGPAQAPLSRLKGEHRAQFFIKGTHRMAMRQALAAALDARPEIKRRTIVDVDPMSVL